jgi:hypothetical protein
MSIDCPQVQEFFLAVGDDEKFLLRFWRSGQMCRWISTRAHVRTRKSNDRRWRRHGWRWNLRSFNYVQVKSLRVSLAFVFLVQCLVSPLSALSRLPLAHCYHCHVTTVTVHWHTVHHCHAVTTVVIVISHFRYHGCHLLLLSPYPKHNQLTVLIILIV